MRTYTISEAAEVTGLSRKAVAHRVERGSLRSVLRNGRRRIPRSELERAGLLPDDGPEFDPNDLLLPQRAAGAGAVPADALVAFMREVFDRFERQATELAQFRALTTQAESLHMAGELADVRARLAALETRPRPEDSHPAPAQPAREAAPKTSDPGQPTLWLPGQVGAVAPSPPEPRAKGAGAQPAAIPMPAAGRAGHGPPRGLRLAAEAFFIIAVAAGTWAAHLEPIAIVAGVAAAWLVTAVFEAASWRRRRALELRIPPPLPRRPS